MTEVVTVAKGDGSGVATARRLIVRTDAEWRTLWGEHAGADVPVPPIDFSTRMVAAAFAGDRPTPGYRIEIVGVRRDGEGLTITVSESRPQPGSVAAQLIVTPFHIISLPRHDGAVSFSHAA